MIFLLGGNGFVGSALRRLIEQQGLDLVVLTRENYESHVGSACDVFLNANGNSKKFMANRDPLWEFDASVRSVAKSLEDFKSTQYIHLSTGDVYPRQDKPEFTLESDTLDPTRMSRYGLHKYIAETLVRGARPDALIFRMGGFVGPHLKKNAIFDMLNNAPVWLDPASELQFISTDKAAEIIWTLTEGGNWGETFNLGAKGTAKLSEIHKRLRSESEFTPDAALVKFEISTDKLERAYGHALPSTQLEIETFFQVLDR